MKIRWKLFLLVGIFLVVGVTLMSLSVVSGSNCSGFCSVFHDQSTTVVPALSPTPIGGGENGVIYAGGGKGNILVFQKDLSDPASITPVLNYEQLGEAVGKTIDSALIRSISPDGKMVDVWVYEPQKRTPYGEYLVSVDLSFLGRLRNGHLDHAQFWSPDSTAVLSKTSMGIFVVRRERTNVTSNSTKGNMLTWSKDGTEIYLSDSRNRLVTYKIEDGTQHRIKVSFLEEINATLRSSSKQELIWYLSFSPISDEVLVATVEQSESRFTIYRTTSDFADASVLATLDYTQCSPSTVQGFDHFMWSPDGQYVFFIPACDDSVFIDVRDGTTIVQKKFILNDDATLVRYPCGWSPDNHFVTVQFSQATEDTLSFWDPTQLDKPSKEVSFSFVGTCPVWLPSPAATQ